MLRGEFDTAGEMSADELRTAYERRLTEVIVQVGEETVRQETSVDEETISALVRKESPEVTLETAAEILATDPDLPDADSIVTEARDILLIGMSIAVLDVEAVAAGINDEMDPKEIQQKAEGRFQMTLDEYALVHNYIEANQ